MADTGRGVNWSLERPCALRRGENWALPRATAKQLADIRAFSNAMPEGMVVDDICVTGHTFGSDSKGKSAMLPTSGFRVSLALAAHGGEAGVREECGSCEGNVFVNKKSSLARCHGHLNAWPDSAQLESELREKASLNGLEADIARLFPPTTLLWYCFWMESPLRRSQCEVIFRLLEGTDDPANKRDDDLRHFLAALRAAIDWELPLHVEMPPPGHTDLGWHTIFPHCPRCKAHAPVPLWQESYDDTPIECEICGNRYSAAATHKMERMDDSIWDADRLEKVLGPDKVECFRRNFLAHRGYKNAQIDDILDRHNNGPLKRRINDLRRRQKILHANLREQKNKSDYMPDKLVLDFSAGVSLRFLLVRVGIFLMGSAGTSEEVGPEGPQHQVRIEKPFYLGEFPVTQAQFAGVMGSNPSRFKGDSDRPVDNISWFTAQEFCMRLSKAVGRSVRLPAEAEWEYACRAGTMGKFHWGENASAEQINCKTGDLSDALAADPAKDQRVTTSIQGRFPPNAWGFYDMHGNVQEWCEDEWHDNYAGAPANGEAWVTPGDENPFRPLRGGSCWHYLTACTAAARQQCRADSEDKLSDSRDDSFRSLFGPGPARGFRVVVEV
jgi:formylglycine-generating enzyme required for sulfatase activity